MDYGMDHMLGRKDEEEHHLVTVDDELEILNLSNEDFAEGISNLILHMLDKKDMKSNMNSGTTFLSGSSVAPESVLLLQDGSAIGN